MIRVYGIKNCDTCRKAIKWLEAHNADYEFRDVRDKPMTRSLIDNWTGQLGWEPLVNRRSTTWRGFGSAAREALDGGTVAATLLAHPTLMKRPVFVKDDDIQIGFDEATLAEWL